MPPANRVMPPAEIVQQLAFGNPMDTNWHRLKDSATVEELSEACQYLRSDRLRPFEIEIKYLYFIIQVSKLCGSTEQLIAEAEFVKQAIHSMVVEAMGKQEANQDSAISSTVTPQLEVLASNNNVEISQATGSSASAAEVRSNETPTAAAPESHTRVKGQLGSEWV